jgi:uncharacterized protein (TIGR02246 family)
MKRKLFAMGVALAASTAVSQSIRAAETSAAEKAIKQAAQAFVDAYDRGDADGVAAQWTKDGEYIVGDTTVKGRDSISKLYGQFFRAHPGSKMEVKIDSIREVAPNVAIEKGSAAVHNSPNGPPSSSGYTAVHVKQNDKWLMTCVLESESPAAAAEQNMQDLGWLVGKWAAKGESAQVELTFDWMTNKNFLRGETMIRKEDGAASGGTQIIGKDPLTGQIVSWFFNGDGGHGYGMWTRDGERWLIRTQGATADGAPTTATNVLYHPDENVLSWQSVNRTAGSQSLPNTKEIVIERAAKNAAGGRQSK